MDKKYWGNRIINQTPYTPGFFPKGRKVVKLNTNENPYPPSEKAIKAGKAAVSGDLRLYPDPNCTDLRAAIAKVYGLKPENVFVSNGSDEVLAFSFLAFMDNTKPVISADVTYSFYPVYAEFFKIEYIAEPLDENWRMPVEAFLKNRGPILLTNPNAPTGIALSLEEIERILKSNPDNVVIVDEAYAAFGAQSAIGLIEKYPNLIVCLTYSKSHSLAGSRVGFALGNENLIAAYDCVKNSYNSYTLDGVALATAEAAILDTTYFEKTRDMVIKTRERTALALEAMGFTVLPSSANFIFISHESVPAITIYEELNEKDVLVRYWNQPRISNFLRVSIGSDNDMDVFLKATREIVSPKKA